jgi:hypothetical protein
MTDTPVSYTKTFSSVDKTTIREKCGELPDPCPAEVAAAWDFIYNVVEVSGPSSGSISFHPGGQLVVLIYPGQPTAIS